jgi:1,2-phenylacetyl-CoA epoxidase catalytic subunit
MTNSQSGDRLDRIEQILLSVSQQQQLNTQAIAQLTNQVDRLSVELEQSIGHMTEVVVQLGEDAERDRQIFQVEIRRIWEYLLQQSGNGRSNGWGATRQ